MSESLPKAPLFIRGMAKAIDLIAVAVVAAAVPPAGIFAGAAYILVSDGLFDGRSIGKKIMKLKVVSASTGKECDFKGSMIRNAVFAGVLILFSIPFVGWIFAGLVIIFEFLLILGSADGMRIGDDFAGTKVIEG